MKALYTRVLCFSLPRCCALRICQAAEKHAPPPPESSPTHSLGVCGSLGSLHHAQAPLKGPHSTSFYDMGERGLAPGPFAVILWRKWFIIENFGESSLLGMNFFFDEDRHFISEEGLFLVAPFAVIFLTRTDTLLVKRGLIISCGRSLLFF